MSELVRDRCTIALYIFSTERKPGPKNTGILFVLFFNDFICYVFINSSSNCKGINRVRIIVCNFRVVLELPLKIPELQNTLTDGICKLEMLYPGLQPKRRDGFPNGYIMLQMTMS